jgi:hypothetical protein
VLAELGECLLRQALDQTYSATQASDTTAAPVQALLRRAIDLLFKAAHHRERSGKPDVVGGLRLAQALQQQAVARRTEQLLVDAVVEFVHARAAFGTLQCYNSLIDSSLWADVSADTVHQQQALAAALEMVVFAEAVANNNEADLQAACALEAMFDLKRTHSDREVVTVYEAFYGPLKSVLTRSVHDNQVSYLTVLYIQ